MNKRGILKGALVVLGIWILLALLIRRPIVPSPFTVFIRLIDEIKKTTIFLHIGVSLFRILVSMILAAALAIPTGIIAARYNRPDKLISPVLYLLYPIPKIAFLPILMVLFGLGNLPKILLVTMILFFPIAIAVRDGGKNLLPEYTKLAKVYRLSGKEIILDIILPGILPNIFSSLRISIGISLSVLFFSENFATTYGIGYYIMNSWIMADYPQMYVGVLILSLTGIALFYILSLIENKIIPWKSWQADNHL